MLMKRLPPALGVLFACLLFAPATWAQPRRQGGFREGFELNPNLAFFHFQDKAEIEDDLGAGFRFGYLYNPNQEIEFLFNDVTADDQFFVGETVDVTNLQVAYVYNFTSHGVVPYFTAGVGFMHADDSSPFLGSETDPVLGLGGGVRFFLGRVTYFRAEWRWNTFEGSGDVFADGESFTFDELSFGLGWRFPTR
jgi:opacity protein-like surface antigen